MRPTHELQNLPDPPVHWEPFVPTPVETENGNAVRIEGIRVLGAKVEKYRETARHRKLTGLEQRDLMEAESAIQTLRKMAPVGELLPARAGELV